MKSIFPFLLYLVSLSCTAQNFNIASDKNNVLFAGIENPVTIVVQNIPAQNVIARTDNGTLTGKDGHYIFYTDTGDIAHITLFKKGSKGEERIGENIFRVRQRPDPAAHLGERSGGKILAAILRSYPGISTDHKSIYYEKGLPITSFTLSIIRNNEYVHKEIKNEGGIFNKDVNNALVQAMPGDSVIFNNIFAKRDDGTTTILPALTFLVID